MRLPRRLTLTARETTLRQRAGAVALAALLIAALLIPHPADAWFAGLPLASWPELAVLGLLLPLPFSARVRTVALPGRRRWIGLAVATILVVIVGLKLTLLALSPPAGFVACYTVDARAACEPSYSDPFGLMTGSRIDRELDFHSVQVDARDALVASDEHLVVDQGIARTNWSLGFVNTLRFNLFGDDASIVRARPAFHVVWRGDLDDPEEPLAVSYVGEGSARLGPTTIVLPPSYERERTIEFRPTGDERRVEIRFAFTPPSELAADPNAPYAAFGLSSADGPVTTALAWSWSVLARVVDAAFVGLAAWLVAAYVRVVRGWLAFPGAVAAAGALATPLEGEAAAFVFGVLTLACLSVFVFWRPTPAGILASATAVAIAGMRVAAEFPHPDTVLYRTGGQDFLTYESFAWELLATGSPRGGEDVFYYQPGFRYVLVVLHSLFGDGMVLIATAILASLLLGVLLLGARLASAARSSSKRGWILAGGGALALIVCSETVVSFALVGATESATWPAYPLAMAAMFSAAPLAAAVGSGGLLGFAYFTRTNQVTGTVLMLAAVVLRLRRRLAGVAIALTAVAAWVLVVPLHNIVYGGVLELLPTSGSIPENVAVYPDDLLDVRSSVVVRAELRAQLERLLYIPATGPPAPRANDLAVAIHGLQLAWIAALAWAFLAARRTVAPEAKLLLFAPVFLLAPFVFYDSITYYPRHILVGYVAMAVAVMCLGGVSPTRGDGRRSPD